MQFTQEQIQALADRFAQIFVETIEGAGGTAGIVGSKKAVENAGAGIRLTKPRQDILDALNTQKGRRAMLQTIADMVRQPKSHTSERLKELVEAGLVRRIDEGSNVWFECVE